MQHHNDLLYCIIVIPMLTILKDHEEVYAVTDDKNQQSLADEAWHQLNEATRILDVAQFTRRDVLEVSGLTETQLKNTLDRDLVTLRSGSTPGSGRRRMFTGSDVLRITVAYTMSAIGFPLRWSHLVADDIERRASNRLIGLAQETGYGFITYPLASGDWARIAIYDGMQTLPKLPPAYQFVEVDRLIDEVLAKLEALIADQQVPDFSVQEPKVEPSPYSPENDFFRMWSKDSEGRNVRIGLTFEETEELMKYEDFATRDDRSAADRERYLALHGKHERARFQRLATENPGFYGHLADDE